MTMTSKVSLIKKERKKKDGHVINFLNNSLDVSLFMLDSASTFIDFFAC